jgi:uncharacterized protein (DUF4415 family)
MSIEHPPLTDDVATFDDENPEWTREMFARARSAAEVLPAEVQAAFAKARGRPRLEAAKIAVKLRLDPDVVQGFKAGGPGWQTRINATLKAALAKGDH